LAVCSGDISPLASAARKKETGFANEPGSCVFAASSGHRASHGLRTKLAQRVSAGS
jgi:hypothetical protein